MKSNPPGIVLLGLGPGDPDQMTQKAWKIIQEAEEVYLRTLQHPAVTGFPAALRIHSFDHLYESSQTFEAVYAAITAQVLALGRRPQGVIYAVPGHPFIAEATAPEIARLARQEAIPVHIVDGLSFLEPVLAALGEDPFPRTSLVDALDIARLHVPTFPVDAPALITQVYSAAVASDVKLTLSEIYPDEHPVRLVHAAGTPQELVEALALYEIDRSIHIGLLTSLYVPPLGPATSFEAFQEVIAHLRAPNGCPWDREQTHRSLRPYLMEETYEVLTALDAGDVDALQEELGDLLLQIVLHAQIAQEEGEFTIADVLQGVNNKIVYRHPHVFGETQVDGVEHVLVNWERLKAAEKKKKGQDRHGVLDGVPLALPALVQADQYVRRTARVGFVWPKQQDVLDKIHEELAEISQAETMEDRSAEVGDLLLAVVDLARSLEVEPESALREANARFRKRFGYIERKAADLEKSISEFSIEQLLAFWQEAKQDQSQP
jgi:tetrapyrrole methylase family protein/MazG family protein